MSAFYSQRGGAYMRDKLPMQGLELKMQGGLCARGEGVIAGFYGMYICLVIVLISQLTITDLSTTLLSLLALSIITPRTCARDKASIFLSIIVVIISTKIARSRFYSVTKQESKTF